MDTASAFVVEIDGETAGLAVADGSGFTFFASSRAAHALDGQSFDTLRGVNAAVARLLGKSRAATPGSLYRTAA